MPVRFVYMGLLDGFLSLGQKINGSTPVGDEKKEGVLSSLAPYLELSTSDDDLLKFSREWDNDWEGYFKKDLKAKQDECEKYYLGKQELQTIEDRPLADNLIFESVETFLPIATRANPEPIVDCDGTDAGRQVADLTRKMLLYQADVGRMKLKLKQATRYWSIYFLGVMKTCWNIEKNDIEVLAIRPQRLILDPNGTIDCGEYTGAYIGENRRTTAKDLISRFPNAKQYIEKKASGNMGTIVGYREYWTNEYVFWRLDDLILGKSKNPHWNYDQETMTVDEMGQHVPKTINGRNHLLAPKMPYSFLSVFNLGIRPHDDTSLIYQNLALQDMVDKRLRQIDTNVDDMNGGWGISGEQSGLSQDQATQAIRTIRKGGGIYMPAGNPATAITRYNTAQLPADVYNSLQDYRNELRNIFGVRGSSPQGTASEDTVRGKIITKTQDADRIGGGITEYIEQLADHVYNQMTQFMYVYYDEPHAGSIIGADKANEYIALSKEDLTQVGRLRVSVKEGSMIPKDPLTKRNEAIDLWTTGALSPVDLFERLDDPNPKETAQRAIAFKINPASLLEQAVQAPMGIPNGTQLEPAPMGVEPQPVETNPLSQVPIQ